MKTLKLSSIAACLLFMVSCTKDADTLYTSSSTATSETYLSATGGKEKVVAGKEKVKPGIVLAFNPEIGIKDQLVTMTGSFAMPAGVAAPTCGELVIEEFTGLDSNLDSLWTKVDEEIVTAADQTIEHTFTPTAIGDPAYSFRVQYKSSEGGQDGKCDGFQNSHSATYGLKVIANCEPLKLEAVTPVKSTYLGNNEYEFELTFKVSSCPALDNAKLQGGLTALSSDPVLSSTDALATGDVRKNTSNDNRIINWYFNVTPNYNKTFTVTFRKTLKGAGPHQIAGSWSIVGTDPKTGSEVRVEIDPVTVPF